MVVFCAAALAVATSGARAGDISGSLPETGTRASLGADFRITNTQGSNGSAKPTAILGIASGLDGRAVAGAASGPGGVAGFFEITSPVNPAGPAVHAVSAAGRNATGPGDYGSAGVFEVTSIENISPALLAQTGSGFTAAVEGISNGDGDGVFGVLNGAGGNAVLGNDLSSGGTGVFGVSTNGTAGKFTGGAQGGGSCTYAGGGAGWSCTSDRNLKEHFAAVDLDAVLDRLDAMPVFYYEMKHSKSPIRYLGPTAQDFKAAFGLGDSETMIASGNEAGVTMAATQALYRKLKDDEAKIAALQRQLAKQDAAMASLQSRLTRVLERIGMREASAGK
jgi:hypothetical protein